MKEKFQKIPLLSKKVPKEISYFLKRLKFGDPLFKAFQQKNVNLMSCLF